MQYGAALALAYTGDDRRAQVLTGDLAKKFPEDTIVQFNYLPTLRAQQFLSRNDPSSTPGANAGFVQFAIALCTGRKLCCAIQTRRGIGSH